MSLPKLTLVPAGAGSGKTYRIQHQLGEWVEQKLVAPQRIVAVTFTEAAAAEMRDRIRRRLLELGRLDDALRLDQAYISTIHGFGLRILTEFAFDAGQSPRPRLLNEDEQDTLIRLALARTDRAEIILRDLSAYGYTFDFATQRGAADIFREHVLEVVGMLRSMGWREDTPRYNQQARVWVAERYGALGDGRQVTRALQDAVNNLLHEFPDSLANQYGNSKAATKDFRDNYRHLRDAQKPGELECNWALWQKLRGLRCSKRGCRLPERYDAIAEAVIAAADTLVTHPGPLAHAQGHIDALLGAGQEVLTHYAQAKREAGLVDYTDMVALAEQLLRDRPDVLKELVNRVDCLVVDEFQDTNPLQFSLLWQLQEAGVPTLIVGDLKQAIMGFQGADPRLLDALTQEHAKIAEPLTSNWRSQPALMDFINALGPGLFGEAYVPLTPQAKVSKLVPLEMVEFPDKIKRGQEAFVQAAHVGECIKALLEDKKQVVVDRRTSQRRRIQGRDVAVLCLTHNTLQRYAKVLRTQGLRVRLEEGGWFGHPAVQVAWYAISYVANPTDRHAALYLAVTWLGSLSLEAALKQLIETGRIDDPLLARLDEVAQEVEGRTVYAVVSDTLRALSLFDVVARWPDAVQARANLLRLQSEAGEFMNANREAKASVGFYGDGLASFQAWLIAKLTDDKKNKQPAPRVQDEDAIELVTWHAAKGREWPVVVVCELDRQVGPRLPNLEIGYEHFQDLANLLDHAKVEFTPKFDAPETTERFSAALQQAAEVEARRLLYVAMTRPREKLVLTWPSYLDGNDKVSYWSILKTATRMELDGSTLQVGDEKHTVLHHLGGATLPGDLDLEVSTGLEDLSVIGRLAIDRQPLPAILTPDSVTPSTLEESPEEAVALDVYEYMAPLTIKSSLPSHDLGIRLHRYFEVLGAKPGLKKALLDISCDRDFSLAFGEAVAKRVVQFESWLQAHFETRDIRREVPILNLTEQGSVMSGVVDLVVRTPQGVWIIDHKSDQIEDSRSSFTNYLSQLRAYAHALEISGEVINGIGIHWIRRCEVVLSTFS